ncbi:MAG: sulfite exporter TauE/SafE family protein, partial [Chitinophagaceae bacterium]
ATGIILLLMILDKHRVFPKSLGLFDFRRSTIFSGLLNRASRQSGHLPLFLFGVLNGILPCGMVYFAMVTALNTGDLLMGMLFMFLFGIGTIPAMLVLQIGLRHLNIRLKNRFRNVIPIYVTILAVFLIVRGISPGFPLYAHEKNDTISCGPTH